MACLVQNTTPPTAHLPVHENLSKKRKLAQPPVTFKKQRIHASTPSTNWPPLYGGPRLDQDTIQYIHKFYCKDCQMDQQAAERAKAAGATSDGAGTGAGAPTGAGPVGEESKEASSGGTTTTEAEVEVEVKQEQPSPVSPPDDASITQALDKNKESLKRKLMMRRSLHELVDQGIYPPPKTPAAFMEQRKSLERAKTGDLLRHKIQSRPDRQSLVQQHILEDTTIDPSLHERQRLLKKARLTDSLNDKLSHRPGVLELVQGNILQTDGKLHQLIKDGSISFDHTMEEDQYNFDDSKSSDEALSPDQTDDSNMSDMASPPVIPPAPELPISFTKAVPFSTQIQFTQVPKVTLPLTTQPFSIPNQTINNISAFPVSGQTVAGVNTFSVQNTSGLSNFNINNNNNNKNRPKKPKPKTQPKTKVIKFHEYKGPPNVVKSSQPVVSPSAVVANINQNNNNSDTPYHILLRQQQLFLQWQLEFNQKNMSLPVILPANKDGQSTSQATSASASTATVTTSAEESTSSSSVATVTTQSVPQAMITVTSPQTHTIPQIQQIRISSPVGLQGKPEFAQVGQPQPQLNPQITPVFKPQLKKSPAVTNLTPPKQFSNLEEMKVAELRAELKRRNLPVSGPKPQLIERLRPYADSIIRSTSDKSPGSVVSPGSSNSVLSPTGSVISRPPSVLSSTGVLSPLSSVIQQVASGVSTSIVFTQSVSINSSPAATLTSPGSVNSVPSVTSPSHTSTISQPASVAPSEHVMSPLDNSKDDPLSTNTLSPFPSIQSMQTAVSTVTSILPEDIAFSPPSSPLFMDNVMSPLSPDIKDLHIASPPDLSSSQNPNLSASHSNVPTAMEQSRPPSVLSVAPSEPEKLDATPMDIDFDFSQSFNSTTNMTNITRNMNAPENEITNQTVQRIPNGQAGNMLDDSMYNQNDSLSQSIGNIQSIVTSPQTVAPSVSLAQSPPMAQQQEQIPVQPASAIQPAPVQQAPAVQPAPAIQPAPIPPAPPVPSSLTARFLSNQQSQINHQQQLIQQIQEQLLLQQQTQRLRQQSPDTFTQITQEELLKQQQQKIEKLQAQLEESQLRLKLQQLQHQQLQQQQQQLQQLQFQQQQQMQNQQISQQIQQQQQQALQQQQQSQIPQQPQVQKQQVPVATVPPQQIQTQATVQVQQQPAVQQQPVVQVPPVQFQSQAQPLQQTPQPQKPVQAVQASVQGMKQETISSPPTPLQATVMPTSQGQTVSPSTSPNEKPKPAPTPQPQVILNLPNNPNGARFQNVAGNSKPIQIPAHLLQAVQNSQGLPTLILTQNPKVAPNKGKAPMLEFIKNQALNQTLNLGEGKSLISVSTAPGGLQQFIITTSTAPKTTFAPVNGLNQTPPQTQAQTQLKPMSLPSSPVESQKTSVGRTSSNPFFVHMKEPPKYDEAVKTIHNQKVSPQPETASTTQKSQTMDDVLEILIRTGELPASAAQEPPPTPKTTSQSPTVPTMSMSQSNRMSAELNLAASATAANSVGYTPSVVFSTPMTVNSLTNQNTVMNSAVNNENNFYQQIQPNDTGIKTENGVKVENCVKVEPESPSTTQSSFGIPPPAFSDTNTNSVDLFDLNDVINSDLNSMDWACDPAFNNLDLTDTTNMQTDGDVKFSLPIDNSLLNMVPSPQNKSNQDVVDTDLANLGFSDTDTGNNMQIDVPDWLDVIMPSTGLTPLSANAPVAFPADPILTPRTQQEVFDLFNFDESELQTPSNLNSGTNWDKLAGTT